MHICTGALGFNSTLESSIITAVGSVGYLQIVYASVRSEINSAEEQKWMI